MPDYKYVLYSKDGNIARITLNKPEKLNCMSFVEVGEDFAEVLRAFDEADEDDDVKVVILKGAGRAFCSGQDLSKVGHISGIGTDKSAETKPSQRVRLKMDRRHEEAVRKLFLFPKISISQVHGRCVGGGITLALTCDLCVTADDAQMSFLNERLGFAGGNVLFPLLMMLVGQKRALDILLTGRNVLGEEAARIGMVSRSVPPEQLEGEVDKLAASLCLLPRDGIALGKAWRHEVYDALGITNCFSMHNVAHTLFTNMRWEPDEFNFFKERREKGTKAAFHERDARYDIPGK